MRRRSGLALIASGMAALAFAGRATPGLPVGMIGATPWQMDDPRFGGFSAIHVTADGLRFTALSDRGAFTIGAFRRDSGGSILSVRAEPLRLLRGLGVSPLRGNRRDAEGIAITRGGTVYVSFEGVEAARVLRYARIDGPAENLPTPDRFASFGLNVALEALAVAPDGTLYTLPERPAPDGVFPVWRFMGGIWDQPFGIPATDSWRAVAAEVGPDGRFYLLERGFHGLAGFATRLRRFDLSDKGVTASRTLVETEAGLHDNLEGLSVWRGPQGLVATMISDNNFRFFQRTEIVEYLLPD
jgi:hypothetical protein